MKMPFGKFKGCAVEDLPRDYLQWLMNNIELREPLASAVEAALGDATDGRLYYPVGLPAELKPMVQEVISTGYRALALKLHPDHGGDHRQMTALNQAKEWLLKVAA